MVDNPVVGIVGFGARGMDHALMWESLPHAEIVIADVKPQSRRSAEERGYKTFATVAEMLDEEEVHLGIVATHAPTHAKTTIAFLSQNIPVICEKPMQSIAPTLRDAWMMVESARVHNTLLAIHHQFVFTDAVYKAEEMIRDGVIGEVKSLRAQGKGYPAPYDWEEIGPHLADICIHFAGEPTSVFGSITKNGAPIVHGDIEQISAFYPEGRMAGIGGGDRICAQYEFQNGIWAIIESTTLPTLPKSYSQFMFVDIYGTEGRLRIYQTSCGRLFHNASPYDDFDHLNGWKEVPGVWQPDPHWIEPTRRVAVDMLAAIDEGRQPRVNGERGLLVQHMLHGAYASHFARERLLLPIIGAETPSRPFTHPMGL